MTKCRWVKRTEALFDGEASRPQEVKQHVAACAVCTAHWEQLERMRKGVAAAAPVAPIGDGQFPGFMDGIRAGVAPRPSRPNKLLAGLSLAAAAMVIALAAFSLFRGGPEPVKATEIEWVSTELEGATVNHYGSGDGASTVWISFAEDDL